MSDSVYVIAEAGVNHNGSLQLARQLIDAAADAGADAVKFQTFRADRLVSRSAPKAAYQQQTTGAEQSQYDLIKQLELDEAAHAMLAGHCATRGIQFLSTPFDPESLALLITKFDLPRIKIPSGEITNAPFLLSIAQTGKPVILSTGMSTLGDIELALGVLAFGYCMHDAGPSVAGFESAYASAAGQQALRENVTLLHCTTEYPAPFQDVNLRAMKTMAEAFGLALGYSDHTQGIAIPVAAVALGATLIEKHFTLDRKLPGPDHQASLEPGELKDMVQAIRQVEMALGSGRKLPAPSELGNRSVARKSLVAACRIGKGEAFTTDNLAAKRPGDGISPAHYWEWLGKIADRDYAPDEKVVF